MGNYADAGPSTFAELLAPLPEDVAEVAEALRTIVRRTIPHADEAVSGGARMGMALYSIGDARNVVCGIQPTDRMCKLFFHGWRQLEEHGFRLEGSGKHARHVKLRPGEEPDPDVVAEMIGVILPLFDGT